MITYVIAVGSRMPSWVEAGFEDYARRLPRHCALSLVEVPAVKRRDAVHKARAEEGRRLLGRVPGNCHLVALAQNGRRMTSRALADELGARMQSGADIALLVGGADGLDAACLSRADACWSLSDLTLPHALVRVIVAEQLYRAWTILAGHPYHRP